MPEQNEKESSGEWVPLFILAIVGVIMLVMLVLLSQQEVQTHVNLVPPIVSTLLAFLAINLARAIRRTGAYLLTLPLLLSSLMAVVISFDGEKPAELQQNINKVRADLGNQISVLEASVQTLTGGMANLQLTVHDIWFKGERLGSWTENLLPKSLTVEGEVIPNTGPQELCFISAINSGHNGDGGRRLVKMIPPEKDGPWRIILLHSNDGGDFIHAQVMCIHLPEPGRLATIVSNGPSK